MSGMIETGGTSAAWGPGGLAVRFFTPAEPNRSGLPNVEKKILGDRHSVHVREANPQDITEFPDAYARWARGEPEPAGTPLTALAEIGANSGLDLELALGHITNLEALARASEGPLRQLLPVIGFGLRKRAREFLLAKASSEVPASVRTALDGLQAQIDALTKRVEEMTRG